MPNYKIFTEEEFNKRVKLFWDLMIKLEFPEWDCVLIEHDISKRRTSNLGMAHYKRNNGKIVPDKMSFSYRMLDGRYTLKYIDNVIRHEIGHLLALLRHGKRCGHNHLFKEIAKEFDFNGKTTTTMEKSEIYDKVKYAEYKYFLICECGWEWKDKRAKGVVRKMMNSKSTKLICACPRCKDDSKFSLYHFPNGIEAGTEVDYEAYYNMFGGTKII